MDEISKQVLVDPVESGHDDSKFIRSVLGSFPVPVFRLKVPTFRKDYGKETISKYKNIHESTSNSFSRSLCLW